MVSNGYRSVNGKRVPFCLVRVNCLGQLFPIARGNAATRVTPWITGACGARPRNPVAIVELTISGYWYIRTIQRYKKENCFHRI